MTAGEVPLRPLFPAARAIVHDGGEDSDALMLTAQFSGHASA
jgi:hypothetical protein